MPKQRVNIALNWGGLGDYIQRMPVIADFVTMFDYLDVTLWCPSYCLSLMQHFLQGKERIQIRDLGQFKDAYNRSEQLIDFESRLFTNQAMTAFSHAEAILFGTFGELDPVFPSFNPDGLNLREELESELSEDYVVILTGATSATRALFPETLQGVTDFLLSQKLKPVFLGKSQLEKNYRAVFPKEFDYSQGVDLREKTSLIEAGLILTGAKAVFGLDSGLCHLAACTPVPLLWAFTTVRPEHRILKRPYADSQTLTLAPEASLGCRFCQSRIRAVQHHDYRICPFGDYECCRQISPQYVIDRLKEVL